MYVLYIELNGKIVLIIGAKYVVFFVLDRGSSLVLHRLLRKQTAQQKIAGKKLCIIYCKYICTLLAHINIKTVQITFKVHILPPRPPSLFKSFLMFSLL